MAIYSRQRDVIMSALKSALYHPTADELYAYLRPSNPSLSLATVYRNLRLMAESGEIMRLSMPGEADRFDPVNDGHYHMICTSCAGITDIDRSSIPDIRKAAGDSCGCCVTGASILFYGVCRECAEKRNEFKGS